MLRVTVFDDGGGDAAYARALAASLAQAAASVRRVTLVAPGAPGGRVFEGQVEVLRCPALLDGAPRLRELWGARAPLAARVPSAHVWRSLLALAPADRVVVVGASTPLARGLSRERPGALVISPEALGVPGAVALALAA